DDGFEEVRAAFIRGDRSKAIAFGFAPVPKELSRLPVLLGGFDFGDIRFEVTVCGENIQSAIKVVIEKEKAELEEALAGGAEIFFDGFVREHEGVALRDVEGVHFIGEVTDGDAEGVVIAETGGVDTHGATHEAISVVGNT